MAYNDLTTLATAKAWLSIDGSNSDVLIQRLLTACSQQVLEYLRRESFISRTYTETFDGMGTDAQMLKNWPVTSVTSVIIDNQVIPAAPLPEGSSSASGTPCGYLTNLWDGTPPGRAMVLKLNGYCFHEGRQNCQVTYTAGYLIANEPWTIPTPPVDTLPLLTVNQPFGGWVADGGITYAADGTPWTRLPILPDTGQHGHHSYGAQGQYAITNEPNGTYAINTFDATNNASVLISYSYCPMSIEQVVLDWINERYRYRSRAGVRSQGLLGQETATFTTPSINQYASDLAPYRHVSLEY